MLPDLIRRARRGDLDAFEAILRTQERCVLTLAYRLMGNLPDAQDAAQEVYLRLYRQIGSFEEGRDLKPWVNRITANVCTDLLRKRRTLVSLDSISPVSADRTDGALEQKERRALVAAALLRLPARQRAAIVLRDMDGLSTAEVAEALQSSETTVRSQISTGRTRLRQIIGKLLRRKS